MPPYPAPDVLGWCGATEPGWIGGLPVAGGDFHLRLLRSDVEGASGCFLVPFFARIIFNLLEAKIGLRLIIITTICKIAILLVGDWQILGIGTQLAQINQTFCVAICLGSSIGKKRLPNSEQRKGTS